ncbi:MAG: DUF349 domain-containing protein, partial [Gammaproteobacteria bacterium]|nr:DUF349 domain-containing protein [Gammaproteobacteria bacterium]
MLKRFLTPKWKHQDLAIRQQALIDLNQEADAEIIAKMATDDPSVKLRNLALEKLNHQQILQSLIDTAKTPSDWCRLAARLNQVNPQIDKLIENFNQQKTNWDNDESFNALMACKDHQLTNQLLMETCNPRSLIKIATSAKSIELRLQAVSEINDFDSLHQLSKVATSKQVLQAVRLKLTMAKEEQKQIDNILNEAERLSNSIKKLSQQTYLDTQYEIKVKLLVEKWQQLDQALLENAALSQKQLISELDKAFQSSLDECQKIITRYQKEIDEAEKKQQILDQQNNLCSQLVDLTEQMKELSTPSVEAFQSVKDALIQINTSWQQMQEEVQAEQKVNRLFSSSQKRLESYFSYWESLVELQPELEQLFSEKPANEFDAHYSWIKSWQQLERKLNWPKDTGKPENLNQWIESAQDIQSEHNKMIAAQKKKSGYINNKLRLLQKHCKERNLIAANKLSNYIGQQLKGTKGDFRASLEKRIENIQPELDELRDWHSFATSPKKNGLCDAMEALINDEIEPLDKAKKVRELQQQWRELISSEANADDELWERFKQASDTAYLPCLEYYAEKDKVRAENLKKQITI